MSRLTFSLFSRDGRARRGQLSFPRGTVQTPAFMPVGTYGTVKGVLPEQIRALGAEIILGNTFHLWLRPGLDIIADHGGLHGFCQWNGPILTDSGGFQVFSLAHRRKITEEGVTFSAPTDGARVFLHAVAEWHDQLRGGAVQMRAAVRHDAIAAGLQRHIGGVVANDGVVAHAGGNRQVGRQAHVVVRIAEVVDAVGNAQQRLLANARRGIGDGPRDVAKLLHHGKRQGDEVGHPARNAVVGKVGAAVRGGNKDGAADLGQGLKLQIGAQLGAQRFVIGRLCADALFDGSQHLPLGVADQQAREHAAHAVPDQREVVRRPRRALRVKVLQRALQRLANGVVVQRQRRIGGVVDLPDLVVAAQGFIAQHLIGHVDPGLWAAGQAMQHDDGAAVGVIGLHQVDGGFDNPVAQAHQGAQRLGGKPRACQPQSVAR